MFHFQKFREVFATLTHRKADAEPTEQKPKNADNRYSEGVSPGTKKPQLPHKYENYDDYYGALSEVAAPAPVERLSEAELARHPSLETGYENSRDDPYGSLSEVAAPQPVERFSEAERARHPSLEQSLSGH
ncbi:hypothetical protein N7451_009136 [Penicillium sp. IBT 35674x]|nr:hypothetical protein N7451_009136 [Penicillium sp. IBT 35674x]